MERNEIKQLLEKYYEGLTSLEEEKVLREYFKTPDVLPEFETDRQLFAYTDSESSIILAGSGLEKKLSDLIDKQDRGKTRKLWGYVSVGVAASIAIFVIGYSTLFRPEPNTFTKDTFNDPQVAYAEAKRALLYVSMQLNRGTEPLSQINKIHEGMDGLNTFSSVGKCLERLELISKYGSKVENENIKN